VFGHHESLNAGVPFSGTLWGAQFGSAPNGGACPVRDEFLEEYYPGLKATRSKRSNVIFTLKWPSIA